MAKTVKDFLDLRIKIIRSYIVNCMLVALITGKTEEPVNVGAAIIPLRGRLRSEVAERRGPKCKLPQFVYANIYIDFSKNPAGILEQYEDFSPFYFRHNVTLEDSYLQYLQKLSLKCTDIFCMNAAKADKIFSDLPRSVAIMLAKENVSAKFWKTGVRKKEFSVPEGEIDQKEVYDYYQSLEQRYSDWKVFNFLLKKLLIFGELKIENPLGEVNIFTTREKKVFVSYMLNKDMRFHHHIMEVKELSPTTWNMEKYEDPYFVRIIGSK